MTKQKEKAMNEDNVTKYPIDVSELEKGDYIQPERITEIYNNLPGTDKFSLDVLRLRGFIERTSRNEMRPLLTKCEKHGVRILKDSESVEYTNSRASAAKRGLVRSVARMMIIDRGNLDHEDNEKLERNIELNSKQLQAIVTAKKELRAAQHERSVPKLSQ